MIYNLKDSFLKELYFRLFDSIDSGGEEVFDEENIKIWTICADKQDEESIGELPILLPLSKKVSIDKRGVVRFPIFDYRNDFVDFSMFFVKANQPAICLSFEMFGINTNPFSVLPEEVMHYYKDYLNSDKPSRRLNYKYYKDMLDFIISE